MAVKDITTKYSGVTYRVNQDNSKTYYIRYKINGKLIREKVGKDAEGITAQYCNRLRAEKMSVERLGEFSPSKIEEKRNKAIPTVHNIATEYLSSIKHLSDYRATVGRYDNHLNTPFGKRVLNEITVDDVKRFVDKKKKEVSFKTGRPYSNKSINDMVNLLNTIYNYAIQVKGLNIVSPAKAVGKRSNALGVVRLSEDNARERYLDGDEIQKLLEAIDKRNGKIDEDLKLFVLIALSTGSRMTSVLNIKKKDINLSTGTITIKNFKTDETYTGFIHDSLKYALEKRIHNLRPIDCIIGGNPEPKHRSSINKALQPTLDSLFNQGLAVEDAQNRVVIHTLRHTFGSLLAIAGTPIFTIKKLMNHKSIEMTMRYAKLAPDQGINNVKSLPLS